MGDGARNRLLDVLVVCIDPPDVLPARPPEALVHRVGLAAIGFGDPNQRESSRP